MLYEVITGAFGIGLDDQRKPKLAFQLEFPVIYHLKSRGFDIVGQNYVLSQGLVKAYA